MIGIVDIGICNIPSIVNSLNKLDIKFNIIKPFSVSDIFNYKKIIMPGVGSFKYAMKIINKNKVDIAIKNYVKDPNNTILGICLGMQLFFDYSEEDGGCSGLRLIKGQVSKLIPTEDTNVPNIGWREISVIKKDCILLQGINDKKIFYFVHSFCCKSQDEGDVISNLDYGHTFDVIVNKNNIYGVQFHPEKSQKLGLSILKNFNEI